MRAPLPPLPWDDVNKQDASDVAHVLGLASAKGGRVEGGRKYPCQWCESSDAAHAYPGGGVHCYSCGRHASNVDLAAHVLGLAPVEALRTLAGRLGVYVPDARTPASNREWSPKSAASRGVTAPVRARESRTARVFFGPTRAGAPARESRPALATTPAATTPGDASDEAREERPEEAPDPDGFAALRAFGMVPTPPPTLYTGLLELLSLADVGADALEGRGFDPAAAEAYGFRALDGAAAWRALRDYLGDSFDVAERAAAGFPGPVGAPDAAPRLPWAGKLPALVIPYRHRGAVVALRFRRLDATDKQRYATLPGVTLAAPFNADALDAAAADDGGIGGELHVVEGELNAYALALHGAHAVGLAGAGAWRAEWAPLVARVGRVVAWYDDDAAGAKGRAKLAEALAEALGPAWLAARGRRYTIPAEHGDVNDLHGAGQLGALLAAAPWRT